MKVMALGLAAALLLAQDPAVPAAWIEQVKRAGSLDPEDREGAVAALKKSVEPQRDLLKRLARSDEQALIISGLVGDLNARGGLIKLLKSKDVDLRRGAAEALSRAPGTGGIGELTAAMEDPDLAVALAAVRALVQIRSASSLRPIQKAFESKERLPKMLGAYGLELLQPKSQTAFIVDRLAGEDGYAIALNTPSVIEALRAPPERGKQQLAKTLKERFERDDMPDAERDMLALLCLRIDVLGLADTFQYLRWPARKPTSWSMRCLPKLRSLHKSVLAYDLVRLMEERAANPPEGDEKAHFAALENLLVTACSGPKPEGEFDARATAYRTWYDRVWTDLVDADVERAIGRGVAWLRALQREDGSWTWCTCGKYTNVNNTTGQTALCGYTLLKMEAAAEDPAVVKAAEYLLKQPVALISGSKTYSISLEAMFFAELLSKPQKEDRRTRTESPLSARALKRIQECVDWLIDARAIADKEGRPSAAWTYDNKTREANSWDHSNSQFAVLGLLAGQNAGIKVPQTIWEAVLNHWKDNQVGDGGWSYIPVPEASKAATAGSTSMTGAGFCCVLIAQAALKKKTTEAVAREEEVVKRAFAKWEGNYPIAAPARYGSGGHIFSVYYDLYSIERPMMLGGFADVGGRDWYHDGALYILWNQDYDSAWIDTSDTCFALLFLKKAFVAVATGK